MIVSDATTAPDLFARFPTTRTGKLVSRVVLEGIENTPGNYQLLYGEGQEGGWTTPRHHHNFEQVRWLIDGDYSITEDTTLKAGAVAYFPESGYYGPQVKGASMKMLTVQFGGPSGQGYISIAQRGRSREELRASAGKFERGLYTWTDADGAVHTQDSSEAEWEHATGRKLEYPEARYNAVIVMHPENFAWVSDAGRPGVQTKLLGTFTERQVRISFIKLAAGASLSLGTERAPEILFIKAGELLFGGEKYGPLHAFGTTVEEEPTALVASQDTECFYVKLPTFD
jgi:hypothetical protein